MGILGETRDRMAADGMLCDVVSISGGDLLDEARAVSGAYRAACWRRGAR